MKYITKNNYLISHDKDSLYITKKYKNKVIMQKLTRDNILNIIDWFVNKNLQDYEYGRYLHFDSYYKPNYEVKLLLSKIYGRR